MMVQAALFPRLGAEKTISRSTDPGTSSAAARSIGLVRPTMGARLLAIYGEYPDGLTAEEACKIAGFLSGGWKRVADLKTADYIHPKLDRNGDIVTRPGSSGREQQVLILTQ